MAKDYKGVMKGLSDKLKNEPSKTPIQEVRPVDPTGSERPGVAAPVKDEVHINFWIPEELMVKLKVRAAESRKTIKQLGIEAIEEFLNKSIHD